MTSNGKHSTILTCILLYKIFLCGSQPCSYLLQKIYIMTTEPQDLYIPEIQMFILCCTPTCCACSYIIYQLHVYKATTSSGRGTGARDDRKWSQRYARLRSSCGKLQLWCATVTSLSFIPSRNAGNQKPSGISSSLATFGHYSRPFFCISLGPVP